MHALEACLALAVAVAPRLDGVPGDRVGVLAVAPPPGPGPELVEITLDLRQRLAEHHAGVLDVRALRERMAGPADGASLAELGRALEGARAAYVSGDHEGAIRTLRAIVVDLGKLPDGEEALALWTTAMLRLARYELNLGREEAARAVIAQVVRAAPELALDRAEHPARLASEVDRARAALAAAPRSPVRITASAEGVRVFVDGRDAGAAPLTLALPRGRCRITGSRGGLRVGPLALEVGDGEHEVLLDFTVAEALRPTGGPGLALPEADQARQLVVAGAHLGLDQLVAVRFVEDAGARHVVGSLYDVRRGMLVREARVRLSNGGFPVGGSSSLAEFLTTGRLTTSLVQVREPREAASLAMAPPRASPASPLVPAGTGAPPATRSRALGWTAVATGVAALGLAYLGLRDARAARASYDAARNEVHPAAWADGLATDARIVEYNRYVTEGDSARRRATLSFAAAGVSAASMGIIGYIHYRRTGDFGPFRF